MLMSIRKCAGDRAEIMLYGVIGWEVNASEFVREISNIKESKINLRIHSDGGSITDGFAIFDAIRRHPAEVTAYIDGSAVSMASVIMLAADKVVANANSWIMIHNPWTMMAGDSEELEREAKVLKSMADQVVAIYVEKTGREEDEIRQMMDATTWMTAQEALELGFIDEISESSAKAVAQLGDYRPKQKPETTEAIMSEVVANAAPEENEAGPVVNDTATTAPAAEVPEAPVMEAQTETEQEAIEEPVEVIAPVCETVDAQDEQETQATIDKAAFAAMVDKYGAAVAAEVMLAGGDERDAEIAYLKRQLAARPAARASVAPVSTTVIADDDSKPQRAGLTQFMHGSEKHFTPKR